MFRVLAASAVALFGAMPAVSQQFLGPSPLTDADFPKIDGRLADLGHKLFFDPLLSGNKNIACATCHHPSLGTSDGVSLSVGEGAAGLGEFRIVSNTNTPHQRIPRNAPALFNLGALEVSVLFHDGRVEIDPSAPFGVRMPEGRELERPVPSILAAQAMLPLLSHDEMAGHPGENDIADAVSAEKIHGADGAWSLISRRVSAVPFYRETFNDINGSAEVHITDIAAAIAHFIADEFRADSSIADEFLAGRGEMPAEAIHGARLFEGKAGCSSCHMGPLLTDQGFHAIAMPQIGPGKSSGSEYYRDSGRFAVTGEAEDMYRFRTPSLRNVALTAPYGHDGAYARLEDVVRHHLDPASSLESYRQEMALLHSEFETGDRMDFAALMNLDEVKAIAEANELLPVSLTEKEIEAILAYLHCLTDEDWAANNRGVPKSVPSGLPIDPIN